ncbi:hypothetical protein PPL_03719 [Heterostelium album PN500]|uniref:Uncharacterized protein n=1 Tax=Heterostelium pallidum (strain ATCC 26659 / Pp 5 / PN500) TaxID=670386 RepID=D3B6H1_HETP5|nr:hypothetical protein PPL_03719 [Heterostelium album PN500]EFA82941.1 hypothetical protein PPL_03719 [Heterostelium album PN500]|eukprot:XP_020435058.1 hypothetical protein PPL_03719 [Heterostelium album PN500]
MPAGQFIKDFQAWRIEQIKATPGTNVALDKLTPQSFMKLTTFTKDVDVVKDKSDEYLMSILNYYQSPLGLKAMGITEKVVPLPEVLDAVEGNDPNLAKTFFTQYSKLFLLQMFCNEKKDTRFPTKISGDVVEDEMKKLGGDTYLSVVTMKLYFLALKKLVPAFLPYILNADQFVPKLKTYLEDPDFVNSFVSAGFTEQKTDVNKNDPMDTQQLNDLKSKLDMLDPTYGLSSNILGLLYNTTLAQYASQSVKETPLTTQIYQNTVQYFITEIDKAPQHEFYQTVQNLKSLYAGNLVTLYQKMSQAFFYVVMEDVRILGGITDKHMYTVDSVTYLEKMGVGSGGPPAYKNLLNDRNFYRMANGLMLGCQLFAIGYGMKNYEKLETYQKALFWTCGGLTILDLVNVVSDAVSNSNIFIFIGKKIATFCEESTSKLSKLLTNMTKYIGKGFQKIAKFVSPVLVLVSIGFSIYDCVQSAKEGDWATFGLSLLEVAAGAALFIIKVAVTASWAGPAALIITSVLVCLSIAKMLVPFIKEIIDAVKEIEEGTPQYQFIESVDACYRYDENHYFALFWKTNYKFSSADGKKLLDDLRKRLPAEDQQNLKEYEAYQSWKQTAVK